MTTTSFIDLPLKQALELKFEIGRMRRTDPDVFDGDPLEELFQECLDGMHYCNYIQKDLGIDLRHRYQQFWSTALEVQSLHRLRNRK